MGILHSPSLCPLAAFLVALVATSGCAVAPPSRAPENTLAHMPPREGELLARYAPVVVSERTEHDYNRIGRPQARRTPRGDVEITVNPGDPVMYARQSDFETDEASYINLVYRVHFEKVPFSLLPFHLTAGKNVGLLFILTLNQQREPLLLTTVHTCGCYLAFIPTNFMPHSSYPSDWATGSQEVFGETLPVRLDYPRPFDPAWRPVIFVRHATHRIRDVRLGEARSLIAEHPTTALTLEPIAALDRLPFDGSTTPFFNGKGFRKGYVKGSFKPFELLLMSWWAFDLHVGSDKAYGDPEETGTVFYTSLKPWRREESNMWEFADFLEYWGWDL